jgi:hypothetical protein
VPESSSSVLCFLGVVRVVFLPIPSVAAISPRKAAPSMGVGCILRFDALVVAPNRFGETIFERAGQDGRIGPFSAYNKEEVGRI